MMVIFTALIQSKRIAKISVKAEGLDKVMVVEVGVGDGDGCRKRIAVPFI